MNFILTGAAHLLDDASIPTTSTGIDTLAQGVVSSVTEKVSMTQVAAVVGIIIGTGIVSIFAWKFGRKAYRYIKNALSGKNANV